MTVDSTHPDYNAARTLEEYLDWLFRPSSRRPVVEFHLSTSSFLLSCGASTKSFKEIVRDAALLFVSLRVFSYRFRRLPIVRKNPCYSPPVTTRLSALNTQLSTLNSQLYGVSSATHDRFLTEYEDAIKAILAGGSPEKAPAVTHLPHSDNL